MADKASAPAQPAADPHGMEMVEPVTIETGAPVEREPGEEVTPDEQSKYYRDPRGDQMKEILANREKQIAKEMEEARRQLGQPEPEPEPEAPVVEAKPEATPPAEAAPAPPVVEKRRIKVNGQEHEYSIEELEKLAQLGLASDQRFQQAAQLRQQAEQLLRQQQHPGVSPEATRATEPARPASTQLDEAEAKRLAQSLIYGNEEQAADAIRKLTTRNAEGRADGPTPEQIRAAAVQDALAIIEQRTALETFGQEYKDVIGSKPLTYVAAQYAQQLRQHYRTVGVPKAEIELYREAGELARKDAQGIASQFAPKAEEPTKPTAAKPPAVSTERVERKRAAPQSPAAASAKTKLADDGPRYPTPSEIVDKMRKERGQPVYR